MEEACKNKDESYTFIKWNNINELISQLKEIRNRII